MADHLGELQELALEYVLDDEHILDAIDVQYAGKVNLDQAAAGPDGLMRGNERVAAGEELADRLGDHEIAVFPSEKQMALVLATSRVLVWSRGGFRGKPKAFLGEVPLGAIEQVTHDSDAGGRQLVVKMWSGWELHLEMVGAGDGGTFSAAFAAQVAVAED